MTNRMSMIFGVIAIVVAILWISMKRISANERAPLFVGPIEPTDADAPTLNRLIGGVKSAIGLGSVAAGAVTSIGGAGSVTAAASGAAVPAMFASVPAEIGIGSTAAAALPGAAPLASAPASGAAPLAGTAGAMSQLASTALVVGGAYLIVRQLNKCPDDQVCGEGGTSYFKDGECDPTSINYDPIACARGAADTVGPYQGNFFRNEEEYLASGLPEYGVG